MARGCILKKHVKIIKSNIIVHPQNNETIVIALAVSDIKSFNNLKKISCENGIPIGGYVFDHISDCYIVNCVDYLFLGSIPVSCKIQMSGCDSWQIDVPMPFDVIKASLSKEQNIEFDKFKTQFEGFKFQFMQLINHN